VTRKKWEEKAVRWFIWPRRLSNIFLALYSIFITTLMGIYSTACNSKDNLSTIQNLAIHLTNSHIGIIIIIGVSIVFVYFVSATLTAIAKDRLSKNGDSCPCVATLLIITRDLLNGIENQNPKHGFDITIFKAINNKKLKVFASTEAVDKKDSNHTISTSYSKASKLGEIEQCWCDNTKTMQHDREQRSKILKRNSKTYPDKKTVIALPIIVFETNNSPWGIVRVRAVQNSDLKVMQNIAMMLNQSNGLIASLEKIFAQQFLCDHYIKFIK
jgi:hypothetical protein